MNEHQNSEPREQNTASPDGLNTPVYKKVSTDLNFAGREKKILEYWQKNNTFKKSIQKREDGPTFTFYDGPPTANGKPHIGHILTRVVKDIIPRYKTMKGYKVLRKAGWDTHGLPVELEVEKNLGLDGKPQIEKYGVEPFIKECKNSVWKYESEWKSMSERVGFWADMENPYVTYHNEYIESVWWALKQIWDKDLIYKGHKIVPYCPRCGTALSSHEVAQGYKDVKEASVYVKFKVEDNLFLLAWTTTPWTLPSHVALVVNPDQRYVKAKCGDEVYILAEARAEVVLKEGYEILESCVGRDLEKLEYQPLFDFVQPEKKAYYVVCDNFVTLDDGTGIVHAAPAFGEDDARVGRENNLPFVQLVNDRGEFVDAVTPWKGVFVKDADPQIIKNLDQRNLLYLAADYQHSYPFCWRCDTALLYYARDTWFIEMTKVKQNLLDNNNQINWIPENIKEGRFGNFLQNVMDWGLSRERYWGTPLPIWECGNEQCNHREMVGSIEQLKEMGKNVPADIELHKPYIDNVFLTCPKCGESMKRVSEVIDCWFDSGSMPFAQWHYPFEHQEIFKENYPAHFISEAIDQTRGWFYTLHAISTLIFDKPAYKNVIVLGHVQDKDGQKMSKHKGNVINPWSILDKYGADSVRWYFYVGSAPWLPSRFYEEAVSEGQRKFMGTLWNTYAFYVLYANIDNFDPTKYCMKDISIMDKWILSGLNSLVHDVNKNLDNYKITESARMIQNFVDDLSNWYVRRSRERFWQKDMPQDKINAFMTLYTTLTTLAKLTAPFVPFMAEDMYTNLVLRVDKKAVHSVHLCDYPVADQQLIDHNLEKNMDLTLRLVVAGRACRNAANIKNRQPIGTMYFKADAQPEQTFISLVEDELNIKNVVYKQDMEQFTAYNLKPNLPVIGRKYGKLIPKISAALKQDGGAIVSAINSGATVSLTIDSDTIELSKEDILIETSQIDGVVCQTERDIIVALDINLTPELIEEGFVREIISKVQTMRKEAGFEVQDFIELYFGDNEKLSKIILDNAVKLKDETLCKDLIGGICSDGYSKDWDINGERVCFAVKKV